MKGAKAKLYIIYKITPDWYSNAPCLSFLCTVTVVCCTGCTGCTLWPHRLTELGMAVDAWVAFATKKIKKKYQKEN